MGKQALIVSENSEIPVVLGAIVGGEWHLRTAPTGRQALEALGELGESLAPDLILLDYDLSDMDGLSFLKSAEERLGGIPPTVLCSSSPLDEAGQARAEEFVLLDILQKPVSHGDLERALGPFLWVSSGSGLTAVEFLGMALRRALSGVYRLESGAMSASLEVREGKLLQIHSGLFVNRWRASLEAEGVALPPPNIDSAVDLRNLEEATVRRPELIKAKVQTVLGILAAFSPAEAVTVRRVGDVESKTGLPVPLFGLVASLVHHCSEEQLAPLRSEVLTLRPGPVGVSPDMPLLPHHGYLLSQCGGPSSLRNILRTGVLPEVQLLRAAYFLLLLGLLGSEPEAPEPFSLAVMAARLDGEAGRIRAQKEGIRNLGESLRSTGQNPYETLGLKPGASYERVVQSFENLRGQLGPPNLHPQVLKEMEAEVDWIKAKVSEAFLLVQAQWLHDRQQRMEADAKESEEEQVRRADPAGKAQAAKVNPRRLEEAERLYRRALSLKEEEEDFHQASQYVRLAIFYNPLSAPYHALQGRLLSMMKSTKAKREAEQCFLKAAELEPRNVEYKIELARLYLGLDLLARCRGMIEKGYLLDPKNTELQGLRKTLREKEKG